MELPLRRHHHHTTLIPLRQSSSPSHHPSPINDKTNMHIYLFIPPPPAHVSHPQWAWIDGSIYAGQLQRIIIIRRRVVVPERSDGWSNKRFVTSGGDADEPLPAAQWLSIWESPKSLLTTTWWMDWWWDAGWPGMILECPSIRPRMLAYPPTDQHA